MSHEEWLASLKPGDEAVRRSNWSMTLVAVDRVTATQFIAGGDRFRRTDGRLIGSSGFNIVSIREPTQKDRDQIEWSQLRYKLEKYVRSESCDLAVLRAMSSCLETKP